MRRALMVIAICCFLPTIASAAIYLVRPDGTGDFPTIQAAINAAAWGDVIELADGEFTGEGNRDISFQGKPITVRSQSGNPEACVINVGGTPEDEHRGFDFSWGEGRQSVLEGVTITGGYVEYDYDWPEGLGGGIRVLGPVCSPTIRNVVFLENLASVGAGLFILNASLVVTDCVFLRNDAWWGGGGGVHAMTSGDHTMQCDFLRCDFIENHGWQIAGGADISGGTGNFTDCRFVGNFIHHGYGAGIAYWIDGHGEITRCTFVENGPADEGGAVFASYDDIVLIRSSTFYGNQAASGAAVRLDYGFFGSLTMENTIIAFNAQGGSITGASASTASLTCCNMYGNVGGNWLGDLAEQLGQNGNIELDPLFCDADNGDFGLPPESPCAPFSEPNPECDLIGAWPVGCSGQDVPRMNPHAGAPMHLSAVPNPFQHTTQIFCSASGQTAEFVTLTVMDPSGRCVQTIQGSGSGPVTWDGCDRTGEWLPGGIYFITASTGEHTTARRVVLIR